MLYLDGRLEKREKSFAVGDGQVAHKGILFKERDPRIGRVLTTKGKR